MTAALEAVHVIALYFFDKHFNIILLPKVFLHVFFLPSGFWTEKLPKCLLSSGLFVCLFVPNP